MDCGDEFIRATTRDTEYVLWYVRLKIPTPEAPQTRFSE